MDLCLRSSSLRRSLLWPEFSKSLSGSRNRVCGPRLRAFVFESQLLSTAKGLSLSVFDSYERSLFQKSKFSNEQNRSCRNISSQQNLRVLQIFCPNIRYTKFWSSSHEESISVTDLVAGSLDLHGWKVLLRDTRQVVGSVDEVIHIGSSDSDEIFESVLKLVCPSGPLDEDFEDSLSDNDSGEEMDYLEFLVPLVGDIVREVDVENNCLFITPPEGLLELARIPQLLRDLEPKLLEFCRHQNEGVNGCLNNVRASKNGRFSDDAKQLVAWIGGKLHFEHYEIFMPTRRQLVAAGRLDLVENIVAAGGFLAVAQSLNLPSRRRPNGFCTMSYLSASSPAFLLDARRVFDHLEEKTVITWTNMIAACAKSDDAESALELFYQMRQQGAEPNEITYLTILKACTSPLAQRWFLLDFLSLDFREDMRNLDAEIEWFVSSSWVKEEDPATGEPVYCNLATGEMSSQEPLLGSVSNPVPVSQDSWDEGTAVMPRQRQVLEAGRYDLHHAILGHGGYKIVAQELGRQPVTKVTNITKKIKSFMEEQSMSHFPSIKELRACGRDDLAYLLRRHGGINAVSDMMDVRPRKYGKGQWRDMEIAAAAIKAYMCDKLILERGLNESSMDRSHLEDMVWKDALRAGTLVVPSQLSFLKDDRSDLRYLLQKFGRKELSQHLGVDFPPRGRKVVSLKW